MINYKDIIKLTKPVRAKLNIGYNAPTSVGYEIILETGEKLQVSPYTKREVKYTDDDDEAWIEIYHFGDLPEDRKKMERKYLKEKEYEDEYYRGLSFEIKGTDLENNFEIIEKGDLSQLDFSKGADITFFAEQLIYSSNNNDYLKQVPKKLQIEFAKSIEEFTDGYITSNELYNRIVSMLYEHYVENKKD